MLLPARRPAAGHAEGPVGTRGGLEDPPYPDSCRVDCSSPEGSLRFFGFWLWLLTFWKRRDAGMRSDDALALASSMRMCMFIMVYEQMRPCDVL